MRTTASYLRVFLFVAIAAVFLMFILSPEAPLKAFTNLMFWGVIGLLGLLMIVAEICIGALQAILYKSLDADAQKRYEEQRQLADANRFKWFRETYKKLLGSKPLEEEHEIILDHNYDGIKELDNRLPPWWLYGFYATIIFGVVYMVRFHIFNDYTQAEEYETEVAIAQAEIEEWKKTAKDLVDVNTVTLLTEAGDLTAGKNIFNESCVACHKADGGGGIGPNLTDEYWILGGGIKNVFNTISEGGRDGKGMVAWKSELKPSQIAQVASYLLTLQGTTPAEPKAAEGEIWVDPEAPVEEIPEKVTDSTTVETSN
ncbi:cbb3-type cytochrome c oxidase N-terminal domain-containing protein [Aureisphaera galaxeae]|uniref:cbb3-type cytochrome c oxidase N-terminal domain-containing protein n=1 Tax=Aureisphaera galaxeae TaxID=1538023 RepID=UPI002350A4E4|nr:cbb3-type cytochrome c oxidase N-terminal domain-containing protein [Aureisphaera galaxeae]MDC8005208.1 cbb3-type cytochrome c oxidase N-terminal domain-containing protein [Aureisphaera galaxeae]